MRILHTSDWHLGKRLFKLDRSEEHALFLDWLIKTIKDEKIDLLLIAGDIFDTPTPPHQSLETFYNFLHRLSVETNTETLIIAGNHDSGLLLEAPAKLLSFHRVKVWGKLSANPKDHWSEFKVGDETLSICAIPFFRSYELLPQGDGDIVSALKTYLETDSKHPKLLMLHHLAGMFEASGSEQVVSLSGIDSIPTELLRTFDYVALGHIHKPQKMGSNIYYSGSPLPMRFSETYAKSVVLLEFKDKKLDIQLKPIPVFRNLHIVRAQEDNWREKLKALEKVSELTPMVEVQLELSSPQIGILDEIKSILDKKGMELLSYLPFYLNDGTKTKKNEKLFELSPLELFEEFYATKYPESPQVPSDLKSDFESLLEKVKHATPPSQN